MRREQREIKDINLIADLINNTNTIRIGINDTPFPYVVPVSFGYEIIDSKITFYFHGAKIGKKAELLASNQYVCIEGDIFNRYMDTIRSVTCLYESFIGYGKCELLENEKAIIHGLQLILDHCGYCNHKIDSKYLPATNVYKVQLQSITAKHRTKDN